MRTIATIILLAFLLPSTFQPTFARKAKKLNKTSAIATLDDEKFNLYYLESVLQREKGNLTAQFNLLRRALEIKPNAPEALFDLAEVASQSEILEPEQIEALYKKATEKSPDNTFYLESYGKYEMKNGNFKEAIPIFRQLSHNELKRATAYQMLVTIYERQQDFDNLIATLDEWEKAEGGSEEIQNMKMKTCFQMKHYEEGFKIASQLIKENPDNDYYPIACAEAYLQKGDTTTAWDTYEKAIQKNPGSLSAQLFRVYYFQYTQNEPQLLDACESVILNAQQPSDIRVSLAQGLISNLKGTKAENRITQIYKKLWQQPMSDTRLPELYGQYLASKNAPDTAYIPCMKKILEINPANESARLTLIQDRLNHRDYKAAAGLCSEGIKLNPRKLLYYYLGGGALFQQKHIDESLQMFSNGTHYVSTTKDKEIVSGFYSAYADALHESGKIRESYACYDSALVYNPSNIVCLNNYAYFLSLAEERLDQAEQMSARTLKIEPDNPTYIDTYAWILFVKKDYEQARAYIEQALKLVKDEKEDASLYEHAGDIYIQLKRKKEARQAWKKALQLGSNSTTLRQKIKKSKYIRP